MTLWLAAAALLLAGSASARTFATVESVCPFTGTKFTGRVDASGTRFCSRFDLKPIGPIGAPPAIPVCPDDGFIVFKERFSAAELEKLRPWVLSDDYKRMTAAETTYFRYAETLRRLGEPSDEVGWALVQATWQVEKEPERYRRYAAAAVEELAKGQGQSLLLAAELERRTKQFDSARARLEELQKDASGFPEGMRRVIERELEYVAERDPSRHYAGDDEERCKALDD